MSKSVEIRLVERLAARRMGVNCRSDIFSPRAHFERQRESRRKCEFRRNPATDSDLKPATVPI